MKYLLDTHILIWWFLGHENLSEKYGDILKKVEASNDATGISIISLWEIALLVAKERLTVHLPLEKWFRQIETHEAIAVLPLSSEIILDSTRLGEGFHKDPADQLITATARCHGLKLMTADERIIKVCEGLVA